MFWLARLIRLERPMPPTPTAAMFSMSLGGVNPRPRTFLGTMAHAAPLAAALARKARREIAFFSLMSRSPREHYCAFVQALRRQVFGVARIRKREGARRRRRRRARERCRRDPVCLLRRGGRSGRRRGARGAGEKILAEDFSD